MQHRLPSGGRFFVRTLEESWRRLLLHYGSGPSKVGEVLPYIWPVTRLLTAVSPNHRPSPPLYPLSPSCGYRQHFPAPTAAPGAPYPR